MKKSKPAKSEILIILKYHKGKIINRAPVNTPYIIKGAKANKSTVIYSVITKTLNLATKI